MMVRKTGAILFLNLLLLSMLIPFLSFPINVSAEELTPVLKEATLVSEEWENGYVQLNEKVTYDIKISLNNTWSIGTWSDVSIFDRFAADLMLDKVLYGSFVVEFEYEEYPTLNAVVNVSSNFGFDVKNFELMSSRKNPLIIKFPEDSNLSIKWKGRSWKVEYEFEFSSQLEEGEELNVHFFVSTDMNPAGMQEYTSYCMHELNSAVTLKFRNVDEKQFSITTGSLDQYYHNDILRDNCVVDVVEYPITGSAYIGYEDWGNGDFDYNDFGMKFSVIEVYRVTDDHYLIELRMNFTAVVYDSGLNHYIHIKRPLNGGYNYTVTRDSAESGEKPAGVYSGSGDLDITLFNSTKYNWPEKEIDETVIIYVVLEDPELNPKEVLEPPRSFAPLGTLFYDLEALMANYDPWIDVDTDGVEWHIEDTQIISNTSNQKHTDDIIDEAVEVPFILVVPYADWIPPFEDTTINGPYQYFEIFYTTGAHDDWYIPTTDNIRSGKNIVNYGGVSWGPYTLT